MAERSFGGRDGASARAEAVHETAATTATPAAAQKRRARGDANTSALITDAMVAAAVAAVVIWLGYRDGGYSLASRTTLAIGLLWAVVVGTALRVLPAVRPSRTVIASAGALALFAVMTAVSSTWTANAEGAFVEFDRVTLYLGVFTLAALAATPRIAARVADAFAVGILVIGLLGLGYRLLPDVINQQSVHGLLPTEFSRLSYPINYWNALGILMALGVPLLISRATAGSPPLRGLALAPVPALSATIYLTSSRTAFVAIAVGLISLVALTEDRWATVGATLVAGAGSALAILVLYLQPKIVNVHVNATAPVGAGRNAAILIAAVCVGTGVAYALSVRYLPPLRPSATAGRVVVGLVLAATVAVVVASHPVRRFDSFRHHLTPAEAQGHEQVQSHLLSLNGSDRWLYWQAAVDQFRSHPLEGGGAGSYEAWWAQHGESSFVRNAHSLYLEVLGELGVIGLLLLAGALLIALVAGIRSVFRATSRERSLRAALASTSVAFLVAAGVDWMWQVTVVCVVGLGSLGLVAGMRDPEERPKPEPFSWRRLALVGATVIAGLALIVGQGISLLADTRLDASQDAVRRGDTAGAVRAALSARDLEPWAATPYAQLALVEEQAGALRSAEQSIEKAIARNRTDWRLWLIAARIQTKRGEIGDARASLARARRLNPRDPSLRP